MSIRRRRTARKGTIVVLATVMMGLMFALMAFSLDIGYLLITRAKLQSAADSAALGGAYDMLRSRVDSPGMTESAMESQAATICRECATKNAGLGGRALDLANSDIVFGRLDLTAGPDGTMTFTDPTRFNALQITVRRNADQNGEVALFFARVLGRQTAPVQATATAAFSDNISGFTTPGTASTTLPILPFAMDKYSWDQMVAGNASDNWKWDASAQKVTSGQDNAREVNLYPIGTGSPGNRGTVDIGNPNNSTADLSRQIRNGINASDMAWMPGGKLDLSATGTLLLGGDTGMSNGIKDDLAAIIGQTRVIPLFTNVGGNGNNAEYTIVQFVGIRVMAVNLTGNPSSRYVMVEPANVMVEGIPGGEGGQYSQYVYSTRVSLTR